MPDYDLTRLAKLLQLAAHPSSNAGEALNSLRAAQSLLAREGVSLADLVDRSPLASADAGETQRLQTQIARLTSDNERLRAANAKLRKANVRLERRCAELEAMSGGEPLGQEPADHAGSTFAFRSKGRITADLLAVYALLADWRSVADLTDKLGPGISQARVKKVVRLLEDQGLLRLVESWPTRYRLRFDGELTQEAKAFRARIEEARPDA